MNDEQVKKLLHEILAANATYKIDIKENQNIFHDLGYESLSFSALIIELEDYYGISITAEDVENGMNTPKKIYEMIQRKLLNG